MLSQIPELELFPADKLTKLAANMSVKKYAAGEFIYKKDQLTSRIFIVEQGLAKIDLSDHGILMTAASMNVHKHSKIDSSSSDQSRARGHLSTDDLDHLLGIIRGVDAGWTEAEKSLIHASTKYEYEDGAVPTSALITKGCILGDKILCGKAGSLHGWLWRDREEKQKKSLTRHSMSDAELAPMRRLTVDTKSLSMASFIPLPDDGGAVCPYNMVAVDDLTVAYFDVDTFERYFGHVEHAFAGNFKEMEPASVQLKKHEHFESTGFDDIQVISLIPLGQMLFGNYKLVVDSTDHSHREHRVKHTHKYLDSKSYVLKIMSKEKIITTHQLEHVAHEKKILDQMKSPYITNLVGCFQTADELFFVFERINNGLGDLWHLLYESQSYDLTVLPFLPKAGVVGLPYTLIQYYTACLVDALANMHPRHIAYRNLKPENIMLDETGRIKLVGFGLAKEIPFLDHVGEALTSGMQDLFQRAPKAVGNMKYKTMTFIGTVEYMAPEIILYTGHDHSVDLWALGILIFEMMFCKTPFASTVVAHHGSSVTLDSSGKVMQESGTTVILDMIKKTVECGVLIPELEEAASSGAVEESMYLAAIDLVSMLLVPEPSRRLGQDFDGPVSIFTHKFFTGLDIENISHGELLPPFKFSEKEKQTNVFKKLLGLPKYEHYRSGDQHVFKSFSDCLQKEHQSHVLRDTDVQGTKRGQHHNNAA
jgi:serine/threonine protein kinase/CRP-like cAMP-binding protein